MEFPPPTVEASGAMGQDEGQQVLLPLEASTLVPNPSQQCVGSCPSHTQVRMHPEAGRVAC